MRTNNKINNIALILFLILNSCQQQKTMQDYTEYQELHNNKGTVHYQVNTLISNKNEVGYTFFDTINKNIITDSYFKSKENRNYESIKIDLNGIILDNNKISTILNDGTKWSNKYYSNWIIDGDKINHNFIDPLTLEEMNNEKKWEKKFIKLYNNATYVYETSWDYYMKVRGEWYFFEYNSKVINEDFTKKYPAKENEDVRMIKLRNLTPDFFSAKADKSFMELINYQETKREDGKGLNPISGSAGYYFIDMYLPNGDTLKIKNFGVMYPNLITYQIPREYGGKDDVYFLIQKPNKEHFPEKQGGMYVIRPRKIK